MKHNLLILVFIFCSAGLYAQKKSIYLLNEFTQGSVLMKNGARASSILNYDAANRKMKFMDKEEIMILTNTQEVDTIYIAAHKFIPANRMFLEVIEVPNGRVYINWNLRELYKGKVGAYGQTSQSTTTTSINTSFYNKGIYNKEDSDILEQVNDNDYWIIKNNKLIKFKDEKSLLKLFPGKETAIKNYIKDQKINIKNPAQMIELTNYSLGLH